jgi:hydroxymethylpyrimidine/phosphomethylpyrimidine kinase
MSIPRLLIIAGSDSSGGAGIQADLKTASALGVFGMTAVTALTAQNTTGVLGVVEVEPKFVVAQIDACVSDVGCDAVKTGMLSSTEMIETASDALSSSKLPSVVVDPVMIAKSGAPLLKKDAVDALKTKLLPLAVVATPNLHEAAALIGRGINTLSEMKDAARAIRDLGPANVVVKGGHLAQVAAHVFYDGHEFVELRAARFNRPIHYWIFCISRTAAQPLEYQSWECW